LKTLRAMKTHGRWRGSRRTPSPTAWTRSRRPSW
jgi:hypothetical protein